MLIINATVNKQGGYFVTVFDAKGAAVMEQNGLLYSTNNRLTKKLDIKGLQSGIYFVVLQSADKKEKQVLRFLKQ